MCLTDRSVVRVYTVPLVRESDDRMLKIVSAVNLLREFCNLYKDGTKGIFKPFNNSQTVDAVFQIRRWYKFKLTSGSMLAA